ncbi:MAG: hypothetical protein E5Y14_04090 [Mesorhizobium sp.]|nr:MAG: hypothetical protein E5Y14_04090 [Mesorhizobium sp.]
MTAADRGASAQAIDPAQSRRAAFWLILEFDRDWRFAGRTERAESISGRRAASELERALPSLMKGRRIL